MSDRFSQSLTELKKRLLSNPGAYCHVSRARIREAATGLYGESRLQQALIDCGFVKKLSREFYRINQATA